MQEVAKQIPNPDAWFWYTLAVVLSGVLGTVLVIVISRYVNKVDSNFTMLTGIMNDMKTMLALHDHRLNGHDEDIKTLEGNYLVRYPKK